MINIITRLGDRVISAFVPQEKAEAVGSCLAYSCTINGHPHAGSYGYDAFRDLYCWYCRS
ncbi:hypothetical protein AB0H88_46600 [Nonomuraea sp. NPDC050680]|uniref:hypothetical protein n=1 Tax=Nonomuraea sp. NPDC050680 TaxID=3154630 RepID=UPI0033F2EC5B